MRRRTPKTSSHYGSRHYVPDPYVFGRPSDKDRDHYARAVIGVTTWPAGSLALTVTLALECGHQITDQAIGPRRRIPHQIFCKECHAAACAKHQKQIPLAPAKSNLKRVPPPVIQELIEAGRRGKHARPT